MASKTIYLDYAAATPLDERVEEAMKPYFRQLFYNPSATYLSSRSVKQALDAAREGVAHWLGARPSEIVFTAGGTEANNLAIHGIMRQFEDANIVVSSIEHESVLAPAEDYDCRRAKVSADGRLELDSLAANIDAKTVLVSVMYANNEVGSIQPLREVAALVAQIRRQRQQDGNKLPLYLHSDACQAANYLGLHASRLGVDLMTINGGKVYGPKQSGALYVRAGIELRPLIEGGGQERGIRSGTENIAGCVGFSKALELAQASRHEEADRLQSLQSEFFKLIANALPQAIINGSIKKRLPNNVHLIFPGTDNERLLIQLDEAGIMGAAGSACSASKEEPSHVLRAMGKTKEEARGSLRLTFGRDTTKSDIEVTVKTLARLLSK